MFEIDEIREAPIISIGVRGGYDLMEKERMDRYDGMVVQSRDLSGVFL